MQIITVTVNTIIKLENKYLKLQLAPSHRKAMEQLKYMYDNNYCNHYSELLFNCPALQ